MTPPEPARHRPPCPVTGLRLTPEAWAWAPPPDVPYTGRRQRGYPAWRCAACPTWHTLIPVPPDHLTRIHQEA